MRTRKLLEKQSWPHKPQLKQNSPLNKRPRKKKGQRLTVLQKKKQNLRRPASSSELNN